MKKVIISITVVAVLTGCSGAPDGSVKNTFKVWGNCGMCEKTIEKSLDRAGVFSADWNRESKIMEVVYDPKKITLEQVHASIAEAGYDTEAVKGSDSAYAGLHSCCKYERK